MRRSALARLVVAIASLCLASHVHSRPPGSEVEVKAAVVFNVLQFVEWPAAKRPAGRPFVLCSLEGGRHATALAQYEGMRTHGTTLSFRLVRRQLEQLAECHAVFVEAGDPYALLKISAATHGLAILLIAEEDQAMQKGAGIGLSVAAGRVVIDINLASLRKVDLAVSSKLLRLAREVIE
ncbi:MAG: YfiR family protein [Rhodocyclaceae bacterium]|nr:YfiR family protein [Rhodocyclaceae bacterium]